MDQRNFLDWMQDLEYTLKLKGVSNDIISIAVAKDLLIENIMELADREVEVFTCEYSMSMYS